MSLGFSGRSQLFVLGSGHQTIWPTREVLREMGCLAAQVSANVSQTLNTTSSLSLSLEASSMRTWRVTPRL